MSFQSNNESFESNALIDLKVVNLNFFQNDLSKYDVIKLENDVLTGLPDEKYYSVIKVNDYLKLPREIKEYLISEERSWRLAAEAIIIRSFTQKLMVDFYFQFNLPLVPTRTFTQSKEAHSWLENLG